MSMVRFANLCDCRDCGARSEEYQMWPVCRECGQDICPTHMAQGSFHEGDGETRSSVVCIECAEPIVIEPLAVAALMMPTDADVADALAAYDREQAKK